MYGDTEKTWSMVCSVVPHLQFDERVRPHLQMDEKMPNASMQKIELDPRCPGQTHFKGPRTAPGNENMEYGCTFKTLCTPSIIHSLSHTDP